MRAVSLFAGIGGFDLGFERAGIESAVQVEIDDKARGVLARHWPTVPQLVDVKEFNGKRFNGVDVVCGGFPCQDLSVAGRRAGLAGERSGLFYEVARILDEAKPEWVVLENVPGLLSSQSGRDMGAVLGTLDDLGYVGAWRVLDAQYFGVAQRRRRVFIVGRLGARGASSVLFEPEGVCGNSPPSREAQANVAGTLGGGSGSRGWCSDVERMTFMASHQRAVGALTQNGVGTCGADDNQAQAGHLIHVPARSACLSTRSERYDADTQTFVAPPGVAVRRLTPTECERLQGFPDGWTDGQVDSARYRQLGNAVAVPVVEWLGRRLVDASR